MSESITNIKSILDADTVYQCELKGGCKLFVPFASYGDDEHFRKTIAEKFEVIESTNTEIEKEPSQFNTSNQTMLICAHCGFENIDPHGLTQGGIVCPECNKTSNVQIQVLFSTSI